MTVLGRDASNFDTSVNYSGLGFFTHKATEGTGIVHDRYGPRLDEARAEGVPVLGAYHVLRTPGSGAGSLAEQLNFWLGYLDAHTPWWRTHPNFMLQVDAERWSYDNVAPPTVLSFARLLVGQPGYHVTYASRGQYGDTLRGIATTLWNADYRGSTAGSYPGDGWVSYGGQPAGWAPYSGQSPVFLQYSDTPYDKDAFRGSLSQLLALTSNPNGGTMAEDTVITWNTGWRVQEIVADHDPIVVPADPAIGASGFSEPNVPKQARDALTAKVDALIAKVDAGGGNVDTAAILARLDALAKQVSATQAEVHQLRTQLATAAQAFADALRV